MRRYFELIVFQSYLQSIEPDTMDSFETIETYIKNRPGLSFPIACIFGVELMIVLCSHQDF
jgi:hypothetical protein